MIQVQKEIKKQFCGQWMVQILVFIVDGTNKAVISFCIHTISNSWVYCSTTKQIKFK